jgi:uracil-DNA glycosylase family 4
MQMKTALEAIHKEVNSCNKCKRVLGQKNLPRSGFPPSDEYKVIIVGAEPSPSAEGMPQPNEYREGFKPGIKNTNKVRLLFEAINEIDLDWQEFFFTNSVKCPATRSQSRVCFENCSQFLDKQIKAINPKLIIIIGRACYKLNIPHPGKQNIGRNKYLHYKAIAICHPQGSSKAYLKKVAAEIKKQLSTT